MPIPPSCAGSWKRSSALWPPDPSPRGTQKRPRPFFGNGEGRHAQNRSRDHSPRSGQTGPCLTDAALIGRSRQAVRGGRYAGTRTSSTAIVAAVHARWRHGSSLCRGTYTHDFGAAGANVNSRSRRVVRFRSRVANKPAILNGSWGSPPVSSAALIPAQLVRMSSSVFGS